MNLTGAPEATLTNTVGGFAPRGRTDGNFKCACSTKPLPPWITDEFIWPYAWEKHGNQTRKGGDILYLGHLLSKFSASSEAGGDLPA